MTEKNLFELKEEFVNEPDEAENEIENVIIDDIQSFIFRDDAKDYMVNTFHGYTYKDDNEDDYGEKIVSIISNYDRDDEDDNCQGDVIFSRNHEFDPEAVGDLHKQNIVYSMHLAMLEYLMAGIATGRFK